METLQKCRSTALLTLRHGIIGALIFAGFSSWNVRPALAEQPSGESRLLRAIEADSRTELERKELREIYGAVGGGHVWTAPGRRASLFTILASLEADGAKVK